MSLGLKIITPVHVAISQVGIFTGLVVLRLPQSDSGTSRPAWLDRAGPSAICSPILTTSRWREIGCTDRLRRSCEAHVQANGDGEQIEETETALAAWSASDVRLKTCSSGASSSNCATCTSIASNW